MKKENIHEFDPLMSVIDVLSPILNYFVQQSVAHGAMFFASVIAYWYFLQLATRNKFEIELKGVVATLTIILSTAILSALCYYVLFKIAWYGQLSYVTLNLNSTDLEGISTGTFQNAYGLIIKKTLESTGYRPYLLALVGSSGKLSTFFTLLSLVFELGLATSLLVNWLFDLVDVTDPLVLLVYSGALIPPLTLSLIVCNYAAFEERNFHWRELYLTIGLLSVALTAIFAIALLIVLIYHWGATRRQR